MQFKEARAEPRQILGRVLYVAYFKYILCIFAPLNFP